MPHVKRTVLDGYHKIITRQTKDFLLQEAALISELRDRKERMATYRFNIQLYAAEFSFLSHDEKSHLVRTLTQAWQWGVEDKLDQLFKQQDQDE